MSVKLTLVETENQTVQQVTGAPCPRPKPEWVRGVCPLCGEAVVSNAYYVGGRGYLIVFECWASLYAEPTCTYRKVL